MRAYLITLLQLLFNVFTSFSQNVSGYILDFQSNPIENAVINVVGGDCHAHTDEKGYFVLNIVTFPVTLSFSHLNYRLDDLTLDSSKVLSLTMEEKPIQLSDVVINNAVNTLKTVSQFDIKLNPVNNAQEILKFVPGLFIGQHAGGGKAEQIFLRGFDLDHGTDINISFDGMPVNMVSHAHGQGYADMHFIIPETVHHINYGKGPYEASKGNFTTAGYVELRSKDYIENNLFNFEIGQYNTKRIVTMLDLYSSEKSNAYIASEYNFSDGPFLSPQGFHRFNIFSKMKFKVGDNQISITSSHFKSQWNASGQIPHRAVESGLISRFGAIDNTEGGITSRTNIQLKYHKALNQSSFMDVSTYYVKNYFKLHSNFTFFLNDSINGDQITQKENREIIGLDLNYKKYFDHDLKINHGIGVRYDGVKENELSRTKNRKYILKNISLGDVIESNLYSYAFIDYEWQRFYINAGARVDFFNFNYHDELPGTYRFQSAKKSILSPKFSVAYNYNSAIQLYIKCGKGFHSNDTRAINNQTVSNIIPAAYGIDFGLQIKPNKNTIFNLAIWQLNMDQEFVYVGDEGVVEAGGKTKRIGVDVSIRYQASQNLFLFNDLNIAKPRALEEAEGNNFIPLAPTFTNTGGINFVANKWSSSFKYRLLTDRPANEDYSILAKGYHIFDFNATYQFKNMSIGIEVDNVFNAEWNETQFSTMSKLKDELNPVEEIHFTPGFPRFIRLNFGFKW